LDEIEARKKGRVALEKRKFAEKQAVRLRMIDRWVL